MFLNESGNQIRVDENSVEFFEALASKVRIRILQLLAINGEMNLKTIADSLGISSAITSLHLNKLEASGLVVSNIIKRNGRSCRICTVSDIDRLLILPKRQYKHFQQYELEIGIGHYTNLNISPTCGIATEEKVIGDFDNPVFFMDPQRVNAQILWFGKGLIEYTIPNYVKEGFCLEEISISLELSSEAPGFMQDWPSDIHFYWDNKHLCTWTCPGEFGGRRGYLSPKWWFDDIIGQYGLLKCISVKSDGTYIDGELVSNTNINDIELSSPLWTFGIGVPDDATNVGGITLFGKKFGDFPQDILVHIYCCPKQKDISPVDMAMLYSRDIHSTDDSSI